MKGQEKMRGKERWRGKRKENEEGIKSWGRKMCDREERDARRAARRVCCLRSG